MALDPKYLQSLPNSLIDMYGLVEIDILSDMARRIATYDYFIPSAQFQMQKLEELGAERTFIIESLSAMTGKAQSEIVDLLTEAGEVAIADDVEYYKAAQVYEPNKIDKEALYKNLNNGLIHTQQAFKNITQTTANTATKQFENALDRAWTQINVGGMDYTTAIKEAIKDLSEAGVGSVEYKSGRVDNIEVAVRRAIVTGANQTAIKTQETLADELDIDLVEVTAHGGARPSHAKWQGQCFSRNGRKVIEGVVYEDLKKATGYGSAGGLCGVNCRHGFHPYVHGTARTWNEKELAKLEEKNIEYNGEKYTEYEASQIQRGIEREIRKRKRMVAALEAAGQDAGEERKKLRDAQKVYTDFTKQTGIRKQSARTQIGTGGTAQRGTTPAPVTPTPAKPIPIKNRMAEIESAKDVAEAEKFADSLVSTYKSRYSGNVSYKGLDIDTANTVNRVLKTVDNEFNIGTFNNITVMNFREKIWSDAVESGTAAAYRWGGSGGDLFINQKLIGTKKTASKLLKQADDLLKTVINGSDKLLSKPGLKPQQKKYIEALIESKRQIAAQTMPDFTEATIVHEMGHALDDRFFRKQFKSLLNKDGFDVAASMDKYAGGISGYAITSVHEYIAESFVAYWYGETEILDPDLVKIFEGARKK